MQQISDVLILELAQNLTEKFKLVTLGTCLGVESSVIHTTFTNNKDDINMASYHILCEWHHTQKDPHTAWCNLEKALVKAELQSVATETLKYSL